MNARGVCTVDGCSKPIRARGWCSMHYRRWQKTGQVSGAERIAPRVRGGVCSVDGCGRKHRANGYCDMHNQRMKRPVNLLVPQVLPAREVVRLRLREGLPVAGPTREDHERWDRVEGVAA